MFWLLFGLSRTLESGRKAFEQNIEYTLVKQSSQLRTFFLGGGGGGGRGRGFFFEIYHAHTEFVLGATIKFH
jgi:hypothetical protein